MRVPGALSPAGVDPIVVTTWSADARRRGIPRGTAQLLAGSGGAEGGRTPDLLIANEALSQLSYGPAKNATVPRVAAGAGHLRPGVQGVKDRPVRPRRGPRGEPRFALTPARQGDYQACCDSAHSLHPSALRGASHESLSLAHPYPDLALHLCSHRRGRDVVADRIQRGQ